MPRGPPRGYGGFGWGEGGGLVWWMIRRGAACLLLSIGIEKMERKRATCQMCKIFDRALLMKNKKC